MTETYVLVDFMKHSYTVEERNGEKITYDYDPNSVEDCTKRDARLRVSAQFASLALFEDEEERRERPSTGTEHEISSRYRNPKQIAKDKANILTTPEQPKRRRIKKEKAYRQKTKETPASYEPLVSEDQTVPAPLEHSPTSPYVDENDEASWDRYRSRAYHSSGSEGEDEKAAV